MAYSLRCDLPRLVRQNHPCSQSCQFLILGPRWPQRTAEGGNVLPHTIRTSSKRGVGACLEIVLSKSGERKVQALACLRKGLAKEFAFGRMNQGVGGEDIWKRRQRPPGSHEDRSAYNPILAEQPAFQILKGRPGQAYCSHKTVCKKLLGTRKFEILGKMIGLVPAAVSWRRDRDALSCNDLHAAGMARDGHQRSPPRMRPNADGCVLHLR